jgi:polyisoprenoid-binding protein YceI
MKRTLLALGVAAAAFGAQAQSATYAIDPNHTHAYFEIGHFGTSTNRGRFEKKEGTVQFDRAGKSGKVEVSFDMTGISTGTAAFDKHLQSPDFFDVAKHPTAKFVGDKFVFDGDKVSEIAGTLTLRGQTQPVTLKATNFNCFNHPMIKREVCGGDFTTTIKRSQFGITYGQQIAPDDVRLLIQVEAIKQQ